MPVRKVTPKVKEAPKQRVVVGIALDSSGSMGSISYQAVEATDRIIQGIKEEAAKTGIETLLTFVTFDTYATVAFENKSISEIDSIRKYYRINGMTALLDAGHEVIDSLLKEDTPNTSFLVYLVTDGGENKSSRSNPEELTKRIRSLQLTDRWTFAFQMPPGMKSEAAKLGVDPSNIREWSATKKGIEDTAVVTRAATAKYYGTKSAGGSTARVSNIFMTDLSKLSVKTLTAKLDDISDHFKEYDVPAEQRADEFTEKKTKKSYVIGQTFYQLMKTETIQPTKQVLLQEKGKKAIWGGEQARDLIGLPKASSGVSIKVKPGNHAGYDVFIQSTSVNRKLPRGTKVLIDVTMTESLKSTWDHLAVAHSV